MKKEKEKKERLKIKEGLEKKVKHKEDMLKKYKERQEKLEREVSQDKIKVKGEHEGLLEEVVRKVKDQLE